jgi:hypothetical protein
MGASTVRPTSFRLRDGLTYSSPLFLIRSVRTIESQESTVAVYALYPQFRLKAKTAK